MMRLKDVVYRSSPYAVQNLLISAYGAYLKSIRYGAGYLQSLSDLEQAEGCTRSEMERRQAERLDSIVRHAVRNVPYYRVRYRALLQSSAPISPRELKDRFEILDKRYVRENSREFVSEAPSPRGRTTVFTSGTTGSPLEVVSTKQAVAENFAFFSHFLRQCGLDPFAWSATFAGRLIVPTAQRKPPFWRCNYAMRTWLFSSYHLGPATASAYLAQLEKIQPTYIDSYPSAIGALAEYVVKEGVRHSVRPKAVVTSSEVLTEHQRRAIEEAFDCKVYDQYGSAEMVVFASQCAAGSYHLHPLYGLTEIVNADGSSCHPGEPGDLVVTGLINDAMPLIRYRIGDRAAFSSTACGCGSSYPALERIFGRDDDYIVTPEGNYVGRLDPLFKGLTGIAEAQVVQESLEQVEVLVVRAGKFEEGEHAVLIKSLQERLGSRMQISVRVVEAIPRTANGKFKSVISKLSSTARETVKDT